MFHVNISTYAMPSDSRSLASEKKMRISLLRDKSQIVFARCSSGLLAWWYSKHTAIHAFPSVYEPRRMFWLPVAWSLLILPFCLGSVHVCVCCLMLVWPIGMCLDIDSPVSTSVMLCSLPDRLAQFAINTPSSRSEALPDGAGAICLADASSLTDHVGYLCVCV